MLNQQPDKHLSKDEMLQALVDIADLASERQSHLAQCTDCQKDLQDLHQGFERLERKARQMAPTPLKSFRLPQSSVRSQVWWRFKPVWAAGAVATMVLATVLLWPGRFEPPGRVANVAQTSPSLNDALLDQVDDLVDNALPPVLQQLTASSDLNDSQSIIDWVVPPVDEAGDDDSWT